MTTLLKKFKPSGRYPVEIFVSVLRESTPSGICDTPDKVVEYWRKNVETSPEFRQDKEQLHAVFLNTRRSVIAHELVSLGTLDATVCNPRDVFRAAIVTNAHAVVIVHNHPSGNVTPSDADIRLTRQLASAGRLIGIELIDSIIVSSPAVDRGYCSLRELGYMHS
jgi:DNA repair protein RadC